MINICIPVCKEVNVMCRVPRTFDTSDPVIFYELADSTTLEHLSVAEGLLEISKSKWPLIILPISNHNKHEIVIPRRSQVDFIQHIAKVMELRSDSRVEGSHWSIWCARDWYY